LLAIEAVLSILPEFLEIISFTKSLVSTTAGCTGNEGILIVVWVLGVFVCVTTPLSPPYKGGEHGAVLRLADKLFDVLTQANW
jgi:hypothetical protein